MRNRLVRGAVEIEKDIPEGLLAEEKGPFCPPREWARIENQQYHRIIYSQIHKTPKFPLATALFHSTTHSEVCAVRFCGYLSWLSWLSWLACPTGALERRHLHSRGAAILHRAAAQLFTSCPPPGFNSRPPFRSSFPILYNFFNAFVGQFVTHLDMSV